MEDRIPENGKFYKDLKAKNKKIILEWELPPDCGMGA